MHAYVRTLPSDEKLTKDLPALIEEGNLLVMKKKIHVMIIMRTLTSEETTAIYQ